MRRQARLAEDFAAALDGRVSARAHRDPTLAPLLALAQHLQALPLGPAPDFRSGLRQRLVAVAAVAPTAPAIPASPVERLRDWSETWRAQRGIATVAAATAAVVGVAGVSVAASRSLPGDPFYGVKRGAEGLQMALARDDISRGERHLQQAEERLDEVAQLVGAELELATGGAGAPGAPLAFGGSKTERVVAALDDMDEATRDGTRLLTRAYERTRDSEPLRTLASFAERQKVNLASVLPELPAGTRDDAADSLDLIAQVEMRADALINNGICGEACKPQPQPHTPVAATPEPQPQSSPTEDDLGPQPCECAAPVQPTDGPTSSPDPEPTPAPSSSGNPSPSPTPSASGDPLPLPLPEPIDSAVEDVIETVEGLLPTPLPLAPEADGTTLEPAHPPLPPALPE